MAAQSPRRLPCLEDPCSEHSLRPSVTVGSTASSRRKTKSIELQGKSLSPPASGAVKRNSSTKRPSQLDGVVTGMSIQVLQRLQACTC
jgi:hypothetical protein